MRPPKFKRLYEVMEINGVKVFAHWSVLLIGATILFGAVTEPAMALAILGSYYGVILLHECGDMVAAQKKHCTVCSIELYPFWGITRFGSAIFSGRSLRNRVGRHSGTDHRRCADNRSNRDVRLHTFPAA